MAHTTHTKPTKEAKVQTPVAATPTPTAAPPAQPNAATQQASASIFAKIKDKVTHITPEQVDAWQKAWLAMPETRKKYEHLEDAPQVVGEELIAMSNDIIDFIQGQVGGHSTVFKKIKESFAHPLDFIMEKIHAHGQAKTQAPTATPVTPVQTAVAQPVVAEAKTVTAKAKAKPAKTKEGNKKKTKKSTRK